MQMMPFDSNRTQRQKGSIRRIGMEDKREGEGQDGDLCYIMTFLPLLPAPSSYHPLHSSATKGRLGASKNSVPTIYPGESGTEASVTTGCSPAATIVSMKPRSASRSPSTIVVFKARSRSREESANARSQQLRARQRYAPRPPCLPLGSITTP